MPSISFTAEVVEIKTKKTLSNDKEFSVKLITSDEEILKLQNAIANSVVQFGCVYD